ncbi:MAG: hypothetical protein NTY31_02060 [Candidatus Falkowbacteria bacterium]|nr:hypothetical protein [Candidatus Falkowbacteria bacterium]
MLNNKKNIIIAGLVVLILITALILTLTSRRNNKPGADANSPAPEFLTAEEKTYFKLDNNVKAQVLGRNASGTPTVYKLINTDADIIADPSKIGPISPRQLETAK